MENMEKIGFFKRIKLSVFNLENYKTFANEKFSKAIKYIFILITIAVVILSIVSAIQLNKDISRLLDYVESEFPDFSIKDGKLEVEKKLEAYDKDYDMKLIVDTSDEVSEETLKAYKDKSRESMYSIILLKDKVIYRVKELSNEEKETHYTSIMDTLKISNITKSEMIQKYFNSNMRRDISIIVWVYAFLSLYLINLKIVIQDVLIVTIFGWIAARLTRVTLKFSQTASLAIYSLTLSIILSTVYAVVSAFYDFEISYFSVMYMLISYIYMVAAIMIMKDNFNDTSGEAVTVEGQVMKTDSDEENEDDESKENEDNKKDDYKKKKLKDKLDEEEDDDDEFDNMED